MSEGAVLQKQRPSGTDEKMAYKKATKQEDGLMPVMMAD